MEQSKTVLTIGILSIVGVLALLLRSVAIDNQGIPAGDRTWKLEITLDIVAERTGETIRHYDPIETRYTRVIRQSTTHPGLKITRVPVAKTNQPDLLATTTKAGRFQLISEYLLQVSPTPRWKNLQTEKPLPADERGKYLLEELGVDPNSELVVKTLGKLQKLPNWKSQPVMTIFQYIADNIVFDPNIRGDTADNALRQRRGNSISRAYAMIALCRAAKLPARLVTGFVLQESIDTTPHFWIEVYAQDTWLSFDPENRYSRELPANFLPFSRKNEPLVQNSEYTSVDIDFDLTEEFVPAGMLGNEKKRLIDIFDFTRLPVQMQSVLTLLLVLPFGVLVTAAVTQFLGVHTYGVFSAAMLAMSLIYADWLTVIIIAVLVIGLGVSGLSMLPNKKISKVPRLTIVMTLVVISTALGVSAMEYFDLLSSPYIFLLPMVVMSNLVDRVYSVTYDFGLRTALIRLVFTCLVALFCLMLFQWQWLSNIVLIYPELHLFTVATVLSFGLYKGRKLKELPQFHWLGDPQDSGKEKQSVQTAQSPE